MAARGQKEQMFREQYKTWLALFAWKHSPSGMGETAVQSYATGMKHKTAVE